MRVRVLCCGVMLAAAGCSVHPLPDDFPRASTVAIVQQIRCEAHDAVQKLRKNNKTVYDRERLKSVAIAYRFHFTITEINIAEAGAGFRLPLSNGTFSLGVDAGGERERVGEREFIVVESFKDIACEKGRRVAGENLSYPITGKIGLEETINTFATLAGLKLIVPGEDRRDSGSGSNPGSGGPGGRDKKAPPEEFTDSLTFTTTIKGGLSPKIELRPLGSGFALSEAEAVLSGERRDKHEVVVALKLPPKTGERKRSALPFLERGAVDEMSDEEYAKEKALESLDRQSNRTTDRRILDLLRSGR